MKAWQEVSPKDSYTVRIGAFLHEQDQRVLSLCYQPLVGATAFRLYQTWYSHVAHAKQTSESLPHSYLFATLDEGLENIFQARLKLEAIGLLQTFVDESGQGRHFLYELSPPLSAEEFLQDGMLNMYLYQKIGSSFYMHVKQMLTETTVVEKAHMKDITRSFDEVFDTEAQPVRDPDLLMTMNPNEDERFLSKEEARSVRFARPAFDVEEVLERIGSSFLRGTTLTKDMKRVVEKLMFIYELPPSSIESILLESLDEKDEFSEEQMRKAARDWYKLEQPNGMPALLDRAQPAFTRTVKEPSTKEEEAVVYFETVAPRQLLRDLSDGEPSASELETVEQVLMDQKLAPGVVNVLLHYCMLKTDMQLTRNYVVKIASHWARKHIKTVPEAMDYAKEHHKQYQQWQDQKKQGKRKPAIRTEKVPEWFEEDRKERKAQLDEQTATRNSASVEEEREKLTRLLKGGS